MDIPEIQELLKKQQETSDLIQRRLDKIDMQNEYIREKFTNIQALIEKETSLLWKEMGNQKQELEDETCDQTKELKEKFESSCNSNRLLIKAEIIQLIQRIQIKVLISILLAGISLITTLLMNILFKR